jgi:YD repeat-containing protein
VLANYTYLYDDAASRTQANETVNGTATVTTWIYDLADRLLRETRYSGTEIIVGSRIADTSFTYDDAGNRTSQINNLASITTTYTYNNLDQLTAVNLPNTTQDLSYTYDARGNMLTEAVTGGATTTYTWDARDRMTSVTAPGLSASYLYDASGRRTRSTVDLPLFFGPFSAR